MSDLFCRLYIDTDEARALVQAAVAEHSPALFQKLNVDAQVLKNKSFDVRARLQSSYDPVTCAPLTAEVSLEDGGADFDERFQAGTVGLVRLLRAKGAFVTASCDFEERIARDTGWNWSLNTTEPPGRVRG